MANEYLKRTPTSTGNRKVWTWSGWVKRNVVISNDNQCPFSAGTDYYALRFQTTDEFRIINFNAGSAKENYITSQKFRDVGNWIHVLVTLNTTVEDSSQRIKLYVNGAEITDFSSSSAPQKNDDTPINDSTHTHWIGVRNTAGTTLQQYFQGEITDVFLVDGQALTPEVFGFYKDGNGYISAGSTQATDFRNGQWVPRTPREIKNLINDNGGFGVNGFYLPMNDSSNFGADFHTTPNSIITLKGEDLPQPRNGAPDTTDAYVSQLREDPYAANLVLAVPGISTATGANLITNGTFESDISGWTAQNAVISSDEGELQVDDSANAGGYSSANQTITTVIGKRYTMTVDIISTSGTPSIAVYSSGWSAQAGDVFYSTYSSTGKKQVIFTATSTSSTISLQTSGTTLTVYDNVVLKQEDAPRDYSADIKGSGTNKTLTANGNAGVGYEIPSYYGSALSFDGTGDYFQLTDNGDFNASGDFTIEFWANLSLNDANAWLFSKWNSGSNQREYTINVTSGGRVDFYWSTDGTTHGSLQTPAGVISADQWNHYVWEKNGSVLTGYINGVAVVVKTDLTSQYHNSSNPLYIGSLGGSQSFDGQIQDLRVYKGVAKYKGGFDVPKPYTPVGISTWRAVPDTGKNNFATLNSIDAIENVTLSEGNLHWSAPSSGALQGGSCRSTINITGGKWYWEVQNTLAARYHNGLLLTNAALPTGDAGLDTTNWVFRSDGYAVHNNSERVYGSDCDDTTGITVMVAFDSDTGKLYFGKNGTWFGNGDPALGTSEPAFSNIPVTDGVSPFLNRRSGSNGAVINFGQNPSFGGRVTSGTYTDSNGKGLFKYQPPEGFLALCEDNLPTPAIKDPGEYFKTVLYTGDSNSGRSITGVGFQPDLVWAKQRDEVRYNSIYDSVRGPDLLLRSDNTAGDVDAAGTGLLSFDTDGFSVGIDNGINKSGNPFVAWCWKAGGPAVTNTDGSIISRVSANQDAGFSIVSWTAANPDGRNTLGHGLGKTPKFIIAKSRTSGVDHWICYHNSLGKDKYILLSSTAGEGSSSNYWSSEEPDSTTFGVVEGTSSSNNAGSMIAYCWTEVEGFSKFGSYVANGDADGAFVYLGFKPAWVMIKATDNPGSNSCYSNGYTSWGIWDSSRNSTNPAGGSNMLWANRSYEEGLRGNGAAGGPFLDIDLLSNGFKIRGSGNCENNSSGITYIFAAFAESPFQTANAK